MFYCVKTIFASILFIFTFLFAVSLHAATTAAAEPECEFLGTYDVKRLNAILTSEYAQFSAYPVQFEEAQCAVDLYKVTYSTVIPEDSNRPVRATGLIAIPQKRAETAPILSYQHGTVFGRDEVPSNPEKSMETRLAIACFAAHGYVVIAADYLGRGGSDEAYSYVIKESTAQTCLDMLFAARGILAQKNIKTSDLFLSGWSQGSYSTLVFLNRLEKLGIPVKAAAFASTPSDIYLCLNKWIFVKSPLDVQWTSGAVAMLIHAYENYYKLYGLADAALRPQYRQAAKDLFDGKITWEETSKIFPPTVNELFMPDFVQAADTAKGGFFKLLQENSAYCWRFKTPTQFYWGGADEIITPYIGTLPVAYQEAQGGAESSGVFGGKTANHRGTFAFGLKAQQKWFAELLAK